MNKETAAKASVIKVPNKLFHSPGETDTHLPIIKKNYNKNEKIKGTTQPKKSMEARKLAEKKKRN